MISRQKISGNEQNIKKLFESVGYSGSIENLINISLSFTTKDKKTDIYILNDLSFGMPTVSPVDSSIAVPTIAPVQQRALNENYSQCKYFTGKMIEEKEKICCGGRKSKYGIFECTHPELTGKTTEIMCKMCRKFEKK